ncbi:MAG TPA: 6-phosphogluconolactonase [Solibacterales bacterium]|nr:6-phosphogluconolactonase [Bryobacterales bacterium]
MRHRFPDGTRAAAACARSIVSALEQSIAERGRAAIALSGGSTVKQLFPLLAAAPVAWDRVHLFWVDERAVPPTHEQSNYRLAGELLIGPAQVPLSNVHRIHSELPPSEAAALYTADLRQHFAPPESALPEFDLIHLGMGSDAHTASLFPGEPLIEDRAGLAAAAYVPKLEQWRITLLPGVLIAARRLAYLAVGADKAEALRSVLREPYEPLRYPAQIGVHHGRNVEWFLDEPAARLIP